VVGSGDTDHLKAGVRVEELRSKQHARLYVSKYVAKLEENLEFDTGRVWGMWGVLDKSTSMTLTLTEKQYLNLRRFFRKWLVKKGKRHYAEVLARRRVGFSILGVGDFDMPDVFGFAEKVLLNIHRI